MNMMCLSAPFSAVSHYCCYCSYFEKILHIFIFFIFLQLGEVCIPRNSSSENVVSRNLGPTGFPLLEMDLSDMKQKARATDDKTETDSSLSNNSGSNASRLSLNDMQIIKIIGSGRFGLIKLAYCRKFNEFVTLNSYQKLILVDTCQQHIPLREKEILESLKHPFITQLVGSFQDNSSLFMVLEMQKGGDLSRLLMQGNNCSSPYGNSYSPSAKLNYRLTDHDKVFYAACVTSVLKYIHSKNIVYRGLHPDTLFIDQDGFLKVTDWGFAKRIDENTFTLCGHVEYLCPEAIIYDTGYGKGADYWALGVLIYEMLAGRSAFVVRIPSGQDSPSSEAGFDDASTVENIITAEITFPPSFSASSCSIISGLCQKNPSLRLGCVKNGRGIKDIMCHPWFSSIDWDKLEKKEVRPPWIPDVTNGDILKYYAEGYAVEDNVPTFDGYNHVEWNVFGEW